ncbi:hypothetical protein BGZ82_001984, partial [Podila clonocystis]
GAELRALAPGPSSLNIDQLQISPSTSPVSQVETDEDVNMDGPNFLNEDHHAQLQGTHRGTQSEHGSVSHTSTSFIPSLSAIRKAATPTHIDVHQRLNQFKNELSQLKDTEFERALNGQPMQPSLTTAIAEHENWIKTIEACLASEQEMDKLSAPERPSRSVEQSLILSDNCPRFGTPIAGQTTMYKIIQKAHVFLAEFRLYHRNSLGATAFPVQCKRMLLLSILDKVKTTQISDAVDLAIKKDDPATNGLGLKRTLWELCEDCFIDKTTTAEEHQIEIDNQIKTGHTKGEKYEEYATRMQYIFRVYKVNNLCTSTLAQLRKTVSPWVCTSMNIFFCIDHPNRVDKVPNNLSDFCQYLSRIEGPDEKRGLDSDGADKSGQNSTPSRPVKKQKAETSKPLKCQFCGPNNTHETDGCLRCRSCHTFGHKTKDCTSPKGE